MAAIELAGITKRFGTVRALRGVDLSVADGEFCVLLGPSGCGKSTLLNIIAGLSPQDEGAVLLDGQPIDHLSPRERDVAMVFQNYALYPHMTVAGNMTFGLRMRGLAKAAIEGRLQETARLLGIEDLLDRKPRELSGGQRQRVAMGRALVRRPRLFLLDEPLSNLDARLRASVRVELKQLHRQIKGTIVYVTHDQVEAMTLGEKVVVMRQGKILQVGPPEEVYDSPADTFVATFIGSPEMNLYQGRMVQGECGLVFEGEGFSLALGRSKPDLAGKEVEVGLRPEDLTSDKDQPITLQAQVELLSNIGSEKYVHARLGEVELTA
ncbi:MAG: sn-glycerol-3-phosphate ABC transporter ATP-binding protein UgpC, partial [Deltaproteobacteria bacterium]|nr:sn-glycerol-3-phosphate ABC transporter ATP-binding protein UgpC [Deltaproteobacteria bacterium]